MAIAVLVSLIDIGATLRVLRETNLGWLAATLLMVPAQVLLRTLRWRYLLPRRPDGRRPAVLRLMPVLLAGYLANLVLPARLGEPVRAYLAARREELAVSRVLGSVLLERVIDLASLAAVAALAAAAAGAPGWMARGIAVVAAVAVALVVLLVASGIPRTVRWLARLAGDRIRRLQRVVDALVSFGEGAGGDGRAPMAAAAAFSTITWFFVAGTYWLLGMALALEISPAGALLIAAVATLGTAIPSAPAYIGTFEIATVVAASALGIPGPEALALALLAHAVVTVPFALAGAAASAWMSVSLSDVAGRVVGARDGGSAAGGEQEAVRG